MTQTLAPSHGNCCGFENPFFEAGDANVFWCPVTCSAVITAIGNPPSFQGPTALLPLTVPACRTTILVQADDRYHMLFAQEHRRLQLDIHGSIDLSASHIRIAVIGCLDRLSAQIISMKRLADLTNTLRLRPSLYAPDPRGSRLAHVLQALDGWLAGSSQREIAVVLFGEHRVRRDWPDPRNHLRDHIRRSIARGQMLMAGGYRQLLK